MKNSLLALWLVLPVLLGLAQEKKDPFPELEKPAPTFRLNNHEAELARVGGPQKHWSVLAFFPKAMTPG